MMTSLTGWTLKQKTVRVKLSSWKFRIHVNFIIWSAFYMVQPKLSLSISRWVSILYFDLGKGNDYLYHGQNRFIGVHTNDELLITAKEEGAIIQKLPQEVFPEYYLIRVNEFNQVAKTPLEEWVKYLKTGIIDPDTTAPGLPEAREKLRYYDMSPEERHEYDEHVNAIMIQNDVLNTAKLEGHAEGRAEGRAEGKLEDARNLKQLGVSIDIIAQATGLSREEIGKL